MCVSVYIHIYKPDSGNHSCAQFIWAIRLQIQPRLDLQKKTPPPILIVGDRTSGVQLKLWLHSAESDRWQPDLTTSGWIWLPGAGMVTIIKKKKDFFAGNYFGHRWWEASRSELDLGELAKKSTIKKPPVCFLFFTIGSQNSHRGPDPTTFGPIRT